MGVYKLTALLQRYAPNSISTVSPTLFTDKTLVFDISCNLYKFVHGHDPHPYNWLTGLYSLTRYCEMYRINPIFVFDGYERIEAKALETAKRQRARLKVEYSLKIEREQSERLSQWIQVSKALCTKIANKTDMKSEFGEISNILNDFERLSVDSNVKTKTTIEKKLIPIAHDLREALDKVQDKDKYTKKVRQLTMKERQLMDELLVNKAQNIDSLLDPLIDENTAAVSSLENRIRNLNDEIRAECRHFLQVSGYTCLTCNGHEAEAMCASIADHGRASASVSEDMDTVVFGDKPLLRHFYSPSQPIMMIDPIKARDGLDLSRESFVDLCILCGTDFSGTIQGIGFNRAYQFIKKYGSIEEVLNNLPDKYSPQPTFNYKLAREVFNNPPPIPMDDKSYERPPVDEHTLKKLMSYYEIEPDVTDAILLNERLKNQPIHTNQLENMAFRPSPFLEP
ncbi:PIN domain-like protein [Pilobolus umbonatus]|nr:PIN domain-like protein [Pilobolus umbonatus]